MKVTGLFLHVLYVFTCNVGVEAVALPRDEVLGLFILVPLVPSPV
jgi:hypothetical protein